ncbi:MAG TPA: hypothetical protein VNV62_26555 [Trebonia sp.]|jgi:hypothetical protein|nr:hypothetical protein [Trebonia sp.]
MSRRDGYGPDDMGDDAQETEVSEYEQYIEDPPEDLVIAEDDDNDAEQATDWAARHPRSATSAPVPDDKSAEESALREFREK